MGSVDGILQLSAAHLAAPFLGADGIADLVVTARANGSGGATETLVTSLGSATQQMIASFPLRDEAGRDALPLAVAAAPLLGSPSLAALGAVDPKGDAALRLWVFPPAMAAFSGLVLSDPFPSGFHAARFGGSTVTDLRYGAHLVAGDLDGDGGDEVVIIAPYGEPTSQSALVVGELRDGRIALSDPVVFDGESTLYSVVRLADVDGDGAADVVFKPLDDTPQDVLILWNDGLGAFSSSRISRVHVEGGINDVVCLNDGADCDLVAVGPDKTFAIEVGADRSISPSEVAGLPGGQSVSAGDFDGDGLSDLAVGTVSELQVFHAIARLP
jgi:hypothetical protein